MLKFGMSEYIAIYEKMFVDNLKRHAAIKKRIDKVLQNPYANT